MNREPAIDVRKVASSTVLTLADQAPILKVDLVSGANLLTAPAPVRAYIPETDAIRWYNIAIS